MPGNPTEDRKIDLNAPLLSVRRLHSAISARGGGQRGGRAVEEEVVDKPVLTARSSLPFYKPDLKSGPVRDPGIVPFAWEQSPGRPKQDCAGAAGDRTEFPPKLPPGSRSGDGGGRVSCTGVRLENVKDGEEKSSVLVEDRRGAGDDGEEDEEKEDDAFSDALETLSLAESGFMNCSISGMTGVGETATATGSSGSCFTSDPQVRDLMMNRFLPAAQAMATETGTPHRTRKVAASPPPRSMENDGLRRPLPLPYQKQPRSVMWHPPPNHAEGLENDEDDDDDGYGSRQLAMQGCGFLIPKFCFKGSFGVMNSGPGVKAKGRTDRPSSQRFRQAMKGSTPQGCAVEPELETWEAVYRHKLGHGFQKNQGENVSKLTAESHPLRIYRDFQSPGGLSPYRRSNGGGISPYRNETGQSPFHEGKGFLGFPADSKIENEESLETSRKGNDRFGEMRPHLSNKSGSGSGSPAFEKTLYIDSVHTLEASKSSSNPVDPKVLIPADKDSDLAAESGRTEVKMVFEACEANKLQDGIPEIGVTVLADGLNGGEERSSSGQSGEEVSVDSSETTKLEDRVKDNNILQPHLPPPLPKSPSESWLWRTLPAISNKNPALQTFLGMQFNSKKKTIQTSTLDSLQTTIKTSNLHSSEMCFSEKVEMPANED